MRCKIEKPLTGLSLFYSAAIFLNFRACIKPSTTESKCDLFSGSSFSISLKRLSIAGSLNILACSVSSNKNHTGARLSKFFSARLRRVPA